MMNTLYYIEITIDMFNFIPSDVSEIVVVYSRTNDVYREMREIVQKFKNKCVEERISDKLTRKTITKYCISYSLGNAYYRSSGKPYLISIKDYFRNSIYYWNDRGRSYLPYAMDENGTRRYKNLMIFGKNSYGYVYMFRSIIISEIGLRLNRYTLRLISSII